MKRLAAVSVAVLTSAIVMLGGFAGPASATRAGGTQRFTIILTGPTGGLVLARGAFTAAGRDVENQTSATTGTSAFTFADGTITASHTDDPGGRSSFNPAACVGRFSATGTFVVTGGTGAYAGISGHGTYRVHGFFIEARTPTGCGAQIGGLTVIRAAGPVSFS